MNCKNCSKQYTCNKEKCEPVKWSETKNYGEIKPRRNTDEIR